MGELGLELRQGSRLAYVRAWDQSSALPKKPETKNQKQKQKNKAKKKKKHNSVRSVDVFALNMFQKIRV